MYQDGDTLAAVIEKLIKRYGSTSSGAQGNSATAPQTYTVNLNINGHNTPVSVASAADANALITALRNAAGNSGLL